MLKYFTISAAVLATTAMNMIAYAGPNISISCFGMNRTRTGCYEDQIAVTNNSSTEEANNLSVECPNLDGGRHYRFWTFDLDPNESKCLDAVDNCKPTRGIFVKSNIEVNVTSRDYARWNRSASCTWQK